MKIITNKDCCENVQEGQFEQWIPGYLKPADFPNIPAKKKFYPLLVNFNHDPHGSIEPRWLREAAIHALNLSSSSLIAELSQHLSVLDSQISDLNLSVVGQNSLIDVISSQYISLSNNVEERFSEILPMMNSLSLNVDSLSTIVHNQNSLISEISSQYISLSNNVEERFSEILPMIHSLSSGFDSLSTIVYDYDDKISTAISTANLAYELASEYNLSIEEAVNTSLIAFAYSKTAILAIAETNNKLSAQGEKFDALIDKISSTVATEDNLGMVRSSNLSGQISVLSSGEMVVNSLGVSKLYTDVDEFIIGDVDTN